MVVIIRDVWARNLDEEFGTIREIIDDFPFISMDTEFPGALDQIKPEDEPDEAYGKLKRNVDELKNMIQLGLTLSDVDGNLPTLGSPVNSYIWQFNFKNFDPSSDAPRNQGSVDFLRGQGIDYLRFVEEGVDLSNFAVLMLRARLVLNDNVTWVTYDFKYDFGYILKILIHEDPLPSQLAEFHELVRIYFGYDVYDTKYMGEKRGQKGGLNKMASDLHVPRVVGNSHTAGSDSLLTCHLFFRLRADCVADNGDIYQMFSGCLYGLQNDCTDDSC